MTSLKTLLSQVALKKIVLINTSIRMFKSAYCPEP